MFYGPITYIYVYGKDCLQRHNLLNYPKAFFKVDMQFPLFLIVPSQKSCFNNKRWG